MSPPASAPRPVATALPTGTLRLLSRERAVTVRVEIAETPGTRRTGLMHRRRLPPDAGMAFLFETPTVYSFWMKNTLIPLDIIWIDKQKRVAHVKTNVPPCKAEPCPSYPPNVPARYVLEVSGGVAAQHGLKAGDPLRIEGIENVVVR